MPMAYSVNVSMSRLFAGMAAMIRPQKELPVIKRLLMTKDYITHGLPDILIFTTSTFQSQ